MCRSRTSAGQRVIVYFYPAAMTPGCTTQAVDFTAAMEELGAAGPARNRNLAGRSGKTHSVPGPGIGRFPSLIRSRQVDAQRVRGVRREAALRQVDPGSHPIDLRDRRGPEGDGTIAVAQYNVKAAGHVDKLKRDLHL